MKPQAEAWLKLAAEDMKMAEAAWGFQYYSACISHCEQAIEKVLKGGLVEKGIEFRKTHDLPVLVDKLGLILDAMDMNFLAKLTEQYLPSRYGDVHIEYSPEMAENYFVTTKRIYGWLLQRLS